MKKLGSRKGESISEALVSVLIVLLSAGMLATLVNSAVRINTRGNEAIDAFYADLTEVEIMSDTAMAPDDGSVTINNDTPASVSYYESGGLISYTKADISNPGGGGNG